MSASRFNVTSALLVCLVVGVLHVSADPTQAAPTIAVVTPGPTTGALTVPTTAAPASAAAPTSSAAPTTILLPAATIAASARNFAGIYSRGTRVSIDATGRVTIDIEVRDQGLRQFVGSVVDAFTMRVDLEGDGRLVYGVYRDCEIDWAGRQAWQKLNCDESASEGRNGADRHDGSGRGGMHGPHRHGRGRDEDESGDDGDDDDEHYRRGRWHHHRPHRLVGTLVFLGAIALSVFCIVRRCRRAHHAEMGLVPSTSFSLPQAFVPVQQLPQPQMPLPSPIVYAAGMRPAATL